MKEGQERKLIIEAHKELFLIRLNTLAIDDAIEQHKNTIEEKGYVWLLKEGKKAKQLEKAFLTSKVADLLS